MICRVVCHWKSVSYWFDFLFYITTRATSSFCEKLFFCPQPFNVSRNFRAPIYNNPEVKQYIDALMTRAVRPICTILQVLGHNRARQRDKWAHLLDDMASLQDEVGLP